MGCAYCVLKDLWYSGRPHSTAQTCFLGFFFFFENFYMPCTLPHYAYKNGKSRPHPPNIVRYQNFLFFRVLFFLKINLVGIKDLITVEYNFLARCSFNCIWFALPTATLSSLMITLNALTLRVYVLLLLLSVRKEKRTQKIIIESYKIRSSAF